MKRSEINQAIKNALNCFLNNGWVLPPNPKWDVTDFGLGNFSESGLVLINLCEESEYCEKIMYATKSQETPLHYHNKKKEDIICRTGILVISVYNNKDGQLDKTGEVNVKVNGEPRNIPAGSELRLNAGERVTLSPGIWHLFYPISYECIIGEVSTANDDQNDNFFYNPEIGRFSEIQEDEIPLAKLINDSWKP